MTKQMELGEAHARTTDPVTSHEAATDMEGEKANKVEEKVLSTLRECGDLTTHDISILSGIPYESVTPRIKPLVIKGLVVDSGIKLPGRSGRRCIVWKAVVK